MAGVDLTRAGHDSAEMNAHREPRHETRNDHNRARRELTLFLAKSRNMSYAFFYSLDPTAPHLGRGESDGAFDEARGRRKI